MKTQPKRRNVMGGDGKFAYLSSFPANFLLPVLHQEFVGVKSDKLLAASGARAMMQQRMTPPAYTPRPAASNRVAFITR
jgi:hypothetical protein